jgi:quinol monooxygenase YgiN
MHARTGKLTAQAGKRGALIEILLRASTLISSLRGCRAYLVLEDLADENSVSVFEVWNDKDSHAESLQNAQVRALIAEAMPVLGGTSPGTELNFRGGHGLELKKTIRSCSSWTGHSYEYYKNRR